MTAAWPETLPHCRLRPAQEALGDGRLRSTTDTGPGKLRPRSSAIPRQFSGSIKATAAQLDILQTFIRDDLGRGSLPFTYASPRGGDDWLVRFNEMPSWTPLGSGKFIVTLSLEVLP